MQQFEPQSFPKCSYAKIIQDFFARVGARRKMKTNDGCCKNCTAAIIHTESVTPDFRVFFPLAALIDNSGKKRIRPLLGSNKETILFWATPIFKHSVLHRHPRLCRREVDKDASISCYFDCYGFVIVGIGGWLNPVKAPRGFKVEVSRFTDPWS